MGKTTGFLEYARADNPYRDTEARLTDYDDLHIAQPTDVRRCQASRCMNCGVPFCQSDFGCPLHNLIPEWNDLLYQGQEQAALKGCCRQRLSRSSRAGSAPRCAKRPATSRTTV